MGRWRRGWGWGGRDSVWSGGVGEALALLAGEDEEVLRKVFACTITCPDVE